MESMIKARPSVMAPTEETPMVYIYPDVLDEMVFNGQWNAKMISLGVLVGNRYTCNKTETEYIEIEGFVGGQHVTSWSEMKSEFEQEWKGALAAQRFHSSESVVVGWYIGNTKALEGDPETLAEIHRTFFRHPWQVGVWFRGGPQPVAFVSSDQTVHPVTIAVIKPTTFSSVG